MNLQRLSKIAAEVRFRLKVEDPDMEEILRERVRKDPSITGILDFNLKPPLPTIEVKPGEEPVKWEFVIQEHFAKRSGHHYDIRLGDPKTGYGYSWAARYLPEPGEKRLAIYQYAHALDYFNFEGTIPDGYYGAGKVKIVFRGKADILSSSPDHIKFNIYDGNEVRTYLLRRQDGDRWLFMNLTDTREKLPDVPDYKEKYKEIPPEKALEQYLNDPKYIFSRKDDGVQMVIYVKPNGEIKLFSPRDAVSTSTGLIEHTFKVPPYGKLKIPQWKESIFRGEFFLTDETGKAIPINEIVQITHSDTITARELIKKKKLKPRLTVFDVVKVKGNHVEKLLPYEEKLKILQKFVSDVGEFVEIPTYAIDPEDKLKLFNAIREGSIPETREGIVIQNLKDVEKPVKTKFKPEWDVYVTGIFESDSPNWKGVYAGGIEYSLEPGGPTVGRVAAGFTLEQRMDMQRNPEKYIGRVAKVRAAGQFPNGALRQPVFVAWHPEKGKELFFEKTGELKGIERWDEILVEAPYAQYTKRDIFNWYMQPKVREKLLEDLERKPVIVIQKFSPTSTVLKRNLGDEKIKITKIDERDVDDPRNLRYWAERRAVEFHKTNEEMTDKAIVDVDPGPGVKFEELKETVKKLVREFKEGKVFNYPIKEVEIRFSGGEGFYVIAHLKKKVSVDELREAMTKYLKSFWENPDPSRYTVTRKPVAGQIRLDLSPMKRGGSIRALYSLNEKTGLVSVPVKNIDTFTLDQAMPENVIKRMKIFEPIRLEG